MNIEKKIKILNVLTKGSLSIMSFGENSWTVHAYQGGTLVGEEFFRETTLDEALNKALQGVMS